MQITYLKGGTFLCIFRTCLANEIEWNESTRNEIAWEIYIDSALEGNRRQLVVTELPSRLPSKTRG